MAPHLPHLQSTTTAAEQPATAAHRARLHQIIFEADTPGGRAFDLALIGAILVSIVLVALETVAGLPPGAYRLLRVGEWALTVLFTLEYGLRLYSVRQPLRYARSFFGVVDLLAILPTYLSLLLPGGQYLLTVRALRLLRIFRVLKLTRFLSEAHGLREALRASLHKISVFLLTVAAIVVIVGSVMYLVEGAPSGFTSIPRSMYWTVVTLTTVGYGDIAPRTPLGQTLAAFVMILGYGIIAVPTGIVTAELTLAGRPAAVSTQACPSCGAEGHDPDAGFCKHCGSAL
jgi:voltage-gated potassium channel